MNHQLKFKNMRTGDKVFDIVNYTLLTLIMVIVLYPVLYIVAASFSDPQAVVSGEVFILPVRPTLRGYEAVFKNKKILTGFANSVYYLVVGTLLNLVMTMLCAYPLSRKEFYGRGIFTGIVVFTMFFDAGIISNYMVVQSAGLMNSIWAIILPGAINVWYMIIMRTFFSDIPEELFESARLDGANDLTIFVKMVLPLSKAVLATMVLFYAVGFWNQWLQPLIYLNDRNRFPMQLILRNIVLGTDAALSKSMSASADMATMSLNIKYAVIFITILPILMVYPFVQKYFVKGVMVGSVKG